METLDLHHHDAEGTGFKLDQVPSEVIANLFRFVPTLDIGRMMVVCKGFNQILSTNPSLWRIVDLDKATPNKSAFKIIKTFATRSRNTLVAIKTPEPMDGEEHKRLISLLEANKGTLRRLDLDIRESRSFKYDEESFKLPSIRAFHSFHNIERLNLTSQDLPEAEEQVPGVLTMLADPNFGSKQPWSQEDLEKISSVRRLHIDNPRSAYETTDLYQVLRACSPNLIHLSISFFLVNTNPEPLDVDLPFVSSLELRWSSSYAKMLTRPLPSLRCISSSPQILHSLNHIIFKNMQTLEFEIERDEFSDGKGHYVKSTDAMTRMVKNSDSTLVTIKLKISEYEQVFHDVDPFLQKLKVDFLLPSTTCPLLSSLFISKEQDYSSSLLAEVMISRNFAFKGWKFSGEDGEEEERRCCSLTLYLDASHINEFMAAEAEVLSTCSKLVRDRAGRTEVREWDGK